MVPPTALEVQSTTDTQIATFSDKLSVNGVPARRSKAPKINGGVAAHASSDMFKSPVRTSSARQLRRVADTVLGTRQAEGETMGSYVRI